MDYMSGSQVLDFVGIPENGNWGFGYGNPDYHSWARQANEKARMFKALTTGQGIVQGGAVGGQSLRVHYLHDKLENISFSQKHCVVMRLIPKPKVWSTTIEYSLNAQPGAGGDGFVSESGSDGLFGIDYADDNFSRQVELVKYMSVGRQVSLVAQEVRNLSDPMSVEKETATRDLISKQELAIYHGDATKSINSFNGIEAQLIAWVTNNPWDADILVDMGGNPLDKAALEDVAIINNNKFGTGNLLIQSSIGFGDSNKLLFPEVRDTEGQGNRRFGTVKTTFDGPNGEIQIEKTPILRPGNPLRPDGPGSDGKPRLTAQAAGLAGPDALSLTFASTPFAAGGGAVAPGAGNFWTNYSQVTDAATLSVLPSLPSGSTNANRLPGGNYYYAISVVWRGRESALYIQGAGTQSSNVIVGTPTLVTPTTGQIVQINIDATTPCITGLGTTYNRNELQWRLYRYGGPGLAAPTLVSQFQYMDTTGTPITGNPVICDNGYKMPGLDNAYLISTTNEGSGAGWGLLQLLPLMQRLGLPELPLASPLVLLWFGTLILWQRRKNIWFRNIGRAS